MLSKLQKSIFCGFLASLALLLVYFTLVGLISGLSFATSQFSMYWYFYIGLTLGFGIQVGLYYNFKLSIKSGTSKSVVVTSGTTSTLTMISCCSHYLVNLLPIIGVAGIATVIAQYQIRLFWIGLVINILGIMFMLYQLKKHRKGYIYE